MANVTTYLQSSLLNKLVEVAAYVFTRKETIANAGALNGDRIQLATITRDARMLSAHLRAVATLGAGCTLKLQRDRAGVYVDLTVATTAGGASLVTSATTGPVDLKVGDVISALVGGADVGAAAAIEVDLLLQH